MKKIIAIAVLVLAAAACSNEKSDPGTSEMPDCGDIWKAGKTLPSDYEGCMDGDSMLVVVYGPDGVVSYDDRFLAELGQAIREAN